MRGRARVSVKRPSARPRSRVAPARWVGASLGVDLGGTKVALGLVDAAGRILEQERIPTGASRPAREVINDIVAQVEQRWGTRLPSDRPLGIGVPGQVRRDGSVAFAPNLSWRDVPLRTELAGRLGRPVEVLNDVQAATYAEWRHGAGRGVDDVVCLFVGTGVGGGIVADGHLYHGVHGTAGEFGHMTIQHHGRPCHCTNTGCLEAYVGGWAIAARAQEAVAGDRRRGQTILALAGAPAAITSETVERAYLAGDALARELVDATSDYLADGLVSIVNAVNPSTIVLGGGVMQGYPSMVPEVERAVRPRALAAAVDGLRIVPAELGGSSGLVGAAAFARERVEG